jgi:lipopolysaccharide biosynthesis glycosyltransferase
MRVCVGIICIGEKYLQEFETLFKPSVLNYCKKHGYDLKIFDSHLDPSHSQWGCISFQKCLVPDALKEYDRVVVMDADIWINETAPAVHTYELGGKIAIVNEVAQVSPEEYRRLKYCDSPINYYSLAGLTINTDSILNTGFMICDTPQFLKDVYWKYIDTAVGHPRRFHYEQACIGYELQTQNMYAPLANLWNWIYVVNVELGTNVPGNVYAVHFAGIDYEHRKFGLSHFLDSRHRPKSLLRWGVRK